MLALAPALARLRALQPAQRRHMSRGSNNPAVAGQRVQSDLHRSQRAHALTAVEQQRLPTAQRAPFAARPGEVNVPQRNAAAVEKALALDARQMADRLVELACLVELVGAAGVKILPVMVVVVRTSKARTFGDHDFVVLQQPCFAVRTVQPQFAQGVAVGHPCFLGWLAAPGVLFGRDTDPHFTKGRCCLALATAPTNQGLAEAIYRFDLVVTGTLPAKHY